VQYYLLLAAITVMEFFLFVLIWRFFRRLKQSETLLAELQNSQSELLAKLQMNATLESELMQSFRQRQSELARLDRLLEERAHTLKALVEQAGEVSRSPQLLREIIINGSRNGHSLGELAKRTGLSVDEVELILAQSGA
jgi:uncharacterized protein HemX